MGPPVFRFYAHRGHAPPIDIFRLALFVGTLYIPP